MLEDDIGFEGAEYEDLTVKLQNPWNTGVVLCPSNSSTVFLFFLFILAVLRLLSSPLGIPLRHLAVSYSDNVDALHLSGTRALYLNPSVQPHTLLSSLSPSLFSSRLLVLPQKTKEGKENYLAPPLHKGALKNAFLPEGARRVARSWQATMWNKQSSKHGFGEHVATLHAREQLSFAALTANNAL